MKNAFNFKKIVFVYFGAILLIFAGYLVYDNFVFRMKSADPEISSGTVPTSIAFFRLNFSQPVKSIGEISLNTKKISKESISIEDKSLKIKINPSEIESNKFYKLELKNVDSKWPSFPIQKLVFDFSAKYTPYNQLSQEQQKALSDMSDSFQIDDPFLTNKFPIFEDDFRIKAQNIDGKYIAVDVAFYTEIPDYDHGGIIKQVPNEKAEELRQKALDSIIKHKGTPSDYKITWSNKYLNLKYSSDKN